MHLPTYICPIHLNVLDNKSDINHLFLIQVRIALEEKQLEYEETFVSLPRGDQNEIWYLHLNPKGLVPMLKIGDALVPESEHILNAIDRLENGKGKIFLISE